MFNTNNDDDDSMLAVGLSNENQTHEILPAASEIRTPLLNNISRSIEVYRLELLKKPEISLIVSPKFLLPNYEYLSVSIFDLAIRCWSLEDCDRYDLNIHCCSREDCDRYDSNIRCCSREDCDRYDSNIRCCSLEDCDRYDDLVDRYHNNVHFINKSQLIRDLILFRLPTSVHSQSTMLGAFGARSSQVDYGERKQIEDFCLNYQSSSVLKEYTKASFFHRVLNHILRQQRYDVIYQHRHAIIELIEQLRRPLPSEDDSVSLVLCRGQNMTIFELEKLKNNVGELVSSSSFLSTTMNPQIAQTFAGNGSDDNPCLVSVIFKIHLDTGQPMRPYALINNSAEEEVLFSPGMRFVLMSCRKLHDNGRFWLFDLKAISEKQQEQLKLNHGETFLLLSSARGWPTSVVVVHL